MTLDRTRNVAQAPLARRPPGKSASAPFSNRLVLVMITAASVIDDDREEAADVHRNEPIQGNWGFRDGF
jgi:hypothetical protein